MCTGKDSTKQEAICVSCKRFKKALAPSKGLEMDCVICKTPRNKSHSCTEHVHIAIKLREGYYVHQLLDAQITFCFVQYIFLNASTKFMPTEHKRFMPLPQDLTLL